ncbi:hypothetical protein ACFPFX_34925 [Streptomyces mauvecolor]|uniref:Uncharacterized protein n=1 Tax=Streptomyces mauvecolor TaxID=58345 RepID=A0ABV9UWC0_9ACTN
MGGVQELLAQLPQGSGEFGGAVQGGVGAEVQQVLGDVQGAVDGARAVARWGDAVGQGTG